jgi:ADP-ribosylglycohydrolase
MKPETKYKGSIKLSAIGDALGWMTEFEKSPQSLKEKFGSDRIEDFFTWKKNVGGRFYGYVDIIKSGSYSDDTQLLLSVARSIKKGGGLDHDYFAKIELANWLDYARGGGRTVKTAADKIKRKSAKWFNNFYTFKVNGENYDYRQSGANGAAMRILPIALANLGNIEKIKEEIFCNSIVTHGHPRAILGALLYGYAIDQIIVFRPEDFSWENYITRIGLDFPKKFELAFINRIEIKEWLREWNKSSDKTFEDLYTEIIAETQNYLRFAFQSIKQNLSVQETLKKLGCFDQATKGSGTSTVIAGIYLAAKFHHKPLNAIIEAVNALGSDTDSIAAFAGGLVGALHGSSIIPNKWKSVQDNEYLDKIAERLLSISEDRFVNDTFVVTSNLKSLNNISKDDFSLDTEIEFIPLGKGKIISIDKQSTLTKGKYNLILEAHFSSGQSIIVSKLFDSLDNTGSKVYKNNETETLFQIAKDKLKPKTFEGLKDFISKQKIISKEQIDIIMAILINED